MGKKKVSEITDPQANTLRVICQIIDEKGLPPTVKELSEALGISHASAHEQIAQLVRKDDILRRQAYFRTIRRKYTQPIILADDLICDADRWPSGNV